MANQELTTAKMEMNLPPLFMERLARILPESVQKTCLATFRAPLVTAFRINKLKATREVVLQALADENIEPQAVSWYEDAFFVSAEMRADLLASKPYQMQQIYVQNLSSMVPPLVLAPEAHETILDLTAAPGSKTLQMACLMHATPSESDTSKAAEGHIAAVEVVRKRFFQLQANLKAQGATNVRTFLKDGAFVWKNRPEFFDKVLLDAPCSTEARFRADDPETYRYWSAKKIKEMAHKQSMLLYSAIQCLQVGGDLVYSTCSFAPEENEAVLQKALDTFGDAISIEALDLPFDNVQTPLDAWQGASFDPQIRNARRILPTSEMEGFFVAKIRKQESTRA